MGGCGSEGVNYWQTVRKGGEEVGGYQTIRETNYSMLLGIVNSAKTVHNHELLDP